MENKLYAIILAIAILVGICGCGAQRQDASSIESNLKEINEGISQFSELKNGTLKVDGFLIAKNHAVESMNTANEEYAYLTTFILNQKGYDYIEERRSLNEKTGEIQYSARKQVDGTLFYSQIVDSSMKERTNHYEWEEACSQSGRKVYCS